MCEQFFPEVSLDVAALRALAARTDGLSDDELELINEENIDQYLRRLKNRDGRFRYEVTRARDAGPVGFRPPKGASFSIKKGLTTINAFPRDWAALQAAPPRVTMTLKGGGTEKIKQFIETGVPQEFGPSEVTEIKTDLPFGTGAKSSVDPLRVSVRQALPEDRDLALRVTFGSAPHSVKYEYLHFRLVRIGTRETEFVSTGPQPFVMGLVLRDGPCDVPFEERPIGAEVREVRKFMDAMHALEHSPRIDFYNLQAGRRLFDAELDPPQFPPHWTKGFENLVRHLATVADAFGVDLRLPMQRPSDDELETLLTQGAIATEEPVPLDSIDFAVTKSSETERHFLETLDTGKANVRLRHDCIGVTLLGAPILTGPVEILLSPTPIKNLEATRQKWIAAKPGEPVEITLGPTDEAVFKRVPPCA